MKILCFLHVVSR
uniref:Uncharacterized protein n=1 Tax=Rhizophora mucronata TaxID=61149 RepID=A0A2P2J0E8_RHIMU